MKKFLLVCLIVFSSNTMAEGSAVRKTWYMGEVESLSIVTNEIRNLFHLMEVTLDLNSNTFAVNALVAGNSKLNGQFKIMKMNEEFVIEGETLVVNDPFSQFIGHSCKLVLSQSDYSGMEWSCTRHLNEDQSKSVKILEYVFSMNGPEMNIDHSMLMRENLEKKLLQKGKLTKISEEVYSSLYKKLSSK